MRRFRLIRPQASKLICLALLLLSTYTTSAVAQRAASSDVQRPDQPATAEGSLRVLGWYNGGAARAATSTVLPDGSLLLAGNWLDSKPESAARQEMLADIRMRFARESGQWSTAYDFPLIWRPEKDVWEIRHRPPGCEHNYYLPSATLMKDGRVFLAGGLCDGPPATRTAQAGPYIATAIWDTAKRVWEAGPSLSGARVRHSATLLADSSVLLAGGMSDTATSSGEIPPVLESVELFVDGKIEAVESLSVARALHTATLLNDGSVLVSGGVDAKGRALSSVELWDPRSRQWHPMQAMADARYAHSATLLPDGRVLVTGGELGGNLLLKSSEIFDPSTQGWSDAAPLPHPLRDHATMTLADGAVLLVGGTREKPSDDIEPWVWMLDSLQQHWLPAGSAKYTRSERFIKPELQLLPDGRVRIFAGLRVLLWQRNEPDMGVQAPIWARAPAMTRLADGQVLLVGTVQGPEGKPPHAYLWDPASGLWSDAGRLEYPGAGATGLIQLGSGRVVHVGALSDKRLVAECWIPGAKTWARCGEVALTQEIHQRVAVGLLPDGRMAVLPSFDEGLLYDEDKQAFDVGQLLWYTEQIVYGGPWVPGDPLAVLKGDMTGSPIDISPLAARFWEGADPNGNYGKNITRQEKERRLRGARMLWDSAHKRWAYVLERGDIGLHAELLPDGCAISALPPSIVDPSTRKWRNLPDPGMGIDVFANTMLVLPNGVVVIAGPPEHGVGSSFYQNQASCAGFAADADARLMVHSASSRIDERTGPNQPGGAGPQAAQEIPGEGQWWDEFGIRLLDNLMWIAMAALVMLLGYRFWSAYPTKHAAIAVMRRKARIFRRSLRREVLWPVKWLMRLIVYGFIVLWVLAMLSPGRMGAWRTAQEDKRSEHLEVDSCRCRFYLIACRKSDCRVS